MESIWTKHGLMPVDELTRVEGVSDTETDTAYWTEYHWNGELVRRDAHVVIKQAPQLFAEQAEV